MSDADGPIRQWVDDLSAPTRVVTMIVVVAIVVGFIVWG
jgi:hypothetical protein